MTDGQFLLDLARRLYATDTESGNEDTRITAEQKNRLFEMANRMMGKEEQDVYGD